MSLSPGSRLGPYEISALIGAGGMGEVYRARDTQLNRDVALKVLPASFATDADRLMRFKREAQTLAALNHPLIAQIFGLEQSGGINALVMECVDGEDLSQRIARGAIPLDEALPLARQIAEALEAAHEQGIVHRDLKPANIKVRPDGTVKVLDFGLAKAVEPGVGNREPGVDQANSPTITSPAMTMRGVILGTAAYMAPEQAKGKPVDRRADIWAFGCVLYEMLTGVKAFDGEDVTEILGAIVKTEPDWTRLPADTRIAIRTLLKRCVTKPIRDRFQAIGDVRFELESLATPPHAGGDAPVTAPAQPRRLPWLIAAAAVVLVVVFLSVARYTVPALEEGAELRLDVATPPTTRPLHFALSPDGAIIVYVATADGRTLLWVRRLDEAEGRPLAGTDDAQYPFWSPDSRSIGFFAQARLKRIDLSGGVIKDLARVNTGRGASWSQSGTILFGRGGGRRLTRVAASGGQEAVFGESTGVGHTFPYFLPDGRRFLVFVQDSEDQFIAVGSLDGGEPRRLMASESPGMFLPPDRVVYIRQGALVAQRVDIEKTETLGEPVTLAASVGLTARVNGGFCVSASGRIAYRGSDADLSRLRWFDRAGKPLDSIESPDSEKIEAVALSPDGRSLAIDRWVRGNRDVWLRNLQRGSMQRFSFDPGMEGYPVWAPDGGRIAFESDGGKGQFGIYVKAASGVGDAALVSENPQTSQWPMDWSSDGRYLLYRDSKGPVQGTQDQDIWALPMTGLERTPVPVATSKFSETFGQFSPDGRFVAYASDESGQPQIVVQPFPKPTVKWQVSIDGGSHPRWSKNGEVYFISPSGELRFVEIQISNGEVEIGAPVVALRQADPGGQGTPPYTVARDGRLLVVEAAADPSPAPITLLLNWKPGPQ